jgi:transposase
MADQIPQDLRRSLKARERGQGLHLAPAVRAEAEAWAERRRAAGATFSAIADELGVSPESVRRWAAKSMPPAPTTALVPVEIVAGKPELAQERRTLTVVAPGGYRVEGLTVDEAAALLRVLR